MTLTILLISTKVRGEIRSIVPNNTKKKFVRSCKTRSSEAQASLYSGLGQKRVRDINEVTDEGTKAAKRVATPKVGKMESITKLSG